MKVGFTGTRRGMSKSQKRAFKDFITEHLQDIEEFHHGDCMGADTDAHIILREDFPRIKVVIHPPSNSSIRAFCLSPHIKTPKEYLERNKDIVNECDVVLGAPETNKEQKRSGTWFTIRYAKKEEKTTIILLRTEGGL